MNSAEPEFLSVLRRSLPPTRSLIDGNWVASSKTFSVLDKYSGIAIAEIEQATREQVANAVSVARLAAAGGAPDPTERARTLHAVAGLLEANRSRLADIMTAEVGFTSVDAHNEIDRAIVTLGLSAEAGLRLTGDMVPFAASPGAHRRIGFTTRFPVGVVCAITPFNSPLNTVLHKIAPAYAAGNAVILKPSAFTPLTAAVIVELFLEAGVPPRFLSLLHGDGDTVGAYLLEEQGIDFYTFTGSTRVGRIIQQAAGLRRTQMELGSIASTLVCADANLDRAIPKIANAAFRKAGQVCTSVQRLYVDETIVEAVTQRLTKVAQELFAGDPRDSRTRVGPLISEEAAVRTEQWIDRAVASGAERLCGGKRHGRVVEPCILRKVVASESIWCKEVFGPVVSVVPFSSFEDAMADANSTPFGLSAGVFTQDIDRALLAARSLRFGSVHLNDASSARADVMPFGGVKDSGFGREGPDYAIREMTEERLVTFNP